MVVRVVLVEIPDLANKEPTHVQVLSFQLQVAVGHMEVAVMAPVITPEEEAVVVQRSKMPAVVMEVMEPIAQ